MNFITLAVAVDTPPYLYTFVSTFDPTDPERSISKALAYVVREGMILSAMDIRAVHIIPGFNKSAIALEPETPERFGEIREAVQELADSDRDLGRTIHPDGGFTT